MAPTLQALGIDRMSVEDRIALATAIWDSIAAEPHPPLLTEAQRLELERRLAEHAANPEDVVPWEQVKAEALARFKQ
ncbi:MAG: addiction module protein [Gemmataceae bacterium]|nr:addiction module protein [Gemmataceae bacterium]